MATSRRGIGWDIGIKNLAYCIIEPVSESSPETLTINGGHYQIHKWADISLVSQIETNLQSAGEVSHINTNLKCGCSKNDKLNAPECGLNAVYCHEELTVDGQYRGYCKKHFKNSGISRMPEIAVRRCYHPTCDSKVSQVLKRNIYMGYCKKHITEMIKSATEPVITAADFLKINRAKTTAKIDINHLGVALFQELDKIRTDITAPGIILLENQPVLKNPTMKSMQMFLYSYYLMREMERSGGLGDKSLQCYTASKKLDMIKFFPEKEQTRINNILDSVKTGYQKNKKQSIMMVEYLLSGNPNSKWLEFFNKHPKQDDLADSLLMTLHYFEKDNLAKLKKINDAKNAKDAKDAKDAKQNSDSNGNSVSKKAKNKKNKNDSGQNDSGQNDSGSVNLVLDDILG